MPKTSLPETEQFSAFTDKAVISVSNLEMDCFDLNILRATMSLSGSYQNSVSFDFNATTAGFVAAQMNDRFNLDGDDKMDEEKVFALLTAGVMMGSYPTKPALKLMEDHNTAHSKEEQDRIKTKRVNLYKRIGGIATIGCFVGGVLSGVAPVFYLAIAGWFFGDMVAEGFGRSGAKKTIKKKVEKADRDLSDGVLSYFNVNSDYVGTNANPWEGFEFDDVSENPQVNEGKMLQKRLPITFRT